jgi:hypothetical protein
MSIYLEGKSMRTDAELLNGLQARLGKYTGKVICRWSKHGRGWRLHETSEKGAHDNVRQAIEKFLTECEKGDQ